MLSILGNILLFFSFLLPLISALLVYASFFCVSSAVFLLVYAYLVSDFSLFSVYHNSSSSTSLLYKLSGLWSDSKGSLLLFVWGLSLYSVLYRLFGGEGGEHKQVTLYVQSFIVALFTLFLIFCDNPFEINKLVVQEGLGLNPLLQDGAMVVHPPILYVGYVGFSIVFSIATAHCFCPVKFSIGKVIKPWLLFAWSFLTIGIGIGAWWAYRELGWGGFWFWDPVENISVLPWMLALALLHAILLTEKNKALEHWTIFLSMFIFIICILGTFLVRSGVLNSVHAFADGKENFLYMLILLVMLVVIGVSSYVQFCFKYKVEVGHNFSSYENSILISNFFFFLSSMAVLVGIFYPVLAQYFQVVAVTIPPSYYNNVLQKILLPFMLLWIVGPQLIIRENLIRNNCLAIFISALVSAFFYTGDFLSFVLVYLSLLLFFLLFISYFSQILVRKKLCHSYYAMFFAHLGGAMLIFSIVCNAYFSSEKEENMQIGQSLEIERFRLKLERVFVKERENYKALIAMFHVNNSFYLMPEVRVYYVEEQSTAETAIYHDFLSDVYVVISEIDKDLGIGVQVHYNKFINLIWLSVLLIALGGLIGLGKFYDSSYRITSIVT